MSSETEYHVGIFTDHRSVDNESNYKQPSMASLKVQVRRTPARDEDLFKRSVYHCPELGRTCDRSGAYDAFDLPSLFDGRRKPYRFADDGSR